MLKFAYKLSLLMLFALFVTFKIKEVSVVANGLVSDRADKLVVLGIIDDREKLSEPVTRSEFAKMVVKSSTYRDKAVEVSSESVCNDVDASTPNAGFIKVAVQNGYMFTYLGGRFCPNDYVTYSDLSRAMLTLLGYGSEDFAGNKKILYNMKFESLNLDDGITPDDSGVITKLDVINGIYKTLIEKKKDSNQVYAESVFNNVRIDRNNELNVDSKINVKTTGPIFITSMNQLSAYFDVNDYNTYLNGILSKKEDIDYDLGNYGYAIIYYDSDRKNMYAYTEREDLTMPVRVMSGYVEGVYYSASDPMTPYRVDIGLHKYRIASEEMGFAFSSSGTFKQNDRIVYICNKINDVSNDYRDSSGKTIRNDDESEPYEGSIINAFHYNDVKRGE